MKINKEVKIICSECGHVDRTHVNSVDIYFPYRKLYDKNDKLITCSNCHVWIDMTIFGKEHVFNMHDMSVNMLPDVLENNRLYNIVSNERKARETIAMSIGQLQVRKPKVITPHIELHINRLIDLKEYWVIIQMKLQVY